MDNPENFMRTNPIDILSQSELDGAENTPKYNSLTVFKGIHEFDLEYGVDKVVHLRQFSSRMKAASWKSNKIKAYWLPWLDGKAASIQLGTEADYFFTSALGGCRMQIGGGANPQVLHIDGKERPINRDRMAAELMPDFATSRKFSFTRDYPTSALAFFVGKAYGTGAARHWRFFAQGIGVDQNTGKTMVVSMRAHGNGVIEV